MDNVAFVNDWKLRASYGSNGTLPSSWTGAYGLYEFGQDYNGVPGASYSQIANPDLQWEKNNTLSIATEARLFDFLNVEIEYYNRKTSDLLLKVPTTRTSGFSYYWDNVGEMTNKGIEVSLTSTNIQNDDFSWTTRLNLAHNKNTIDKLEGGDNVDTFPYILREGKSFNSIYMRDWAGVNPENGHGQWYVLEDEKRVDKNDDGKWDITEDTRYAGK
jgi:outer membrane receptor protein involved in Fe transport